MTILWAVGWLTERRYVFYLHRQSKYERQRGDWMIAECVAAPLSYVNELSLRTWYSAYVL